MNKLRPKLPLPLPDYQDLLQETRIWAIEAIERYDDTKGAAFETTLYKHLNIRSMQKFNFSWFSSNQPQNKWVFSFSVLRSEEGKDPDIMEFEDEEIKAKGIAEKLSERNKELFEYFVKYLDWEAGIGENKLLPAFASDLPITKVAKLTGICHAEVASFISEFKDGWKALKEE